MRCVFKLRSGEGLDFKTYRCISCLFTIQSKYTPELIDRTCNIDKRLDKYGPGTVLRVLLRTLSIKERKNCLCRSLSEVMDTFGRKWSWENRNILSQMMYREAKRRGLNSVSVRPSTAIPILGIAIAISWVLSRLVKKAEFESPVASLDTEVQG